MSVIAVNELASYLRVAEADLDPGAALLVTLANGLVIDAFGDAESYPAHVKATALEVAARAYRNPGGYSSESVDDYTYRRDADTRKAGVYLTDAERALLTGGQGSRMGWLM